MLYVSLGASVGADVLKFLPEEMEEGVDRLVMPRVIGDGRMCDEVDVGSDVREEEDGRRRVGARRASVLGCLC